jgi:hypothetical protein
MYRRDGESHKYVDKDNIYLSVSEMEINTEIDLRVYTGHTVCKPAYTLLYFVNGCDRCVLCKNKIGERITGHSRQATALQNV